MNPKSKAFPILIIVLLLALALPNVISLIRGPAETPDVFSDGYSLAEAMQISQQQGKPIFAVATADWCAPCQSLKRGPLQDPELVAIIREHAIPVYLEDGEDRDEIKKLGPSGYPTSFIVDGEGRVLAKVAGGGALYGDFLRQELVPVP